MPFSYENSHAEVAIRVSEQLQLSLLEKYKVRQPQVEAREDAIAFIGLKIGIHSIESSLVLTNPEDRGIDLREISKLSRLLSEVREGDWKGVKSYFQSEARESLSSAAFRTTRYADETKEIAEGQEQTSTYFLNLGRSI